jgi:hypothetical protein
LKRTSLLLVIAATASLCSLPAFAQNGPAEFSSAPCSSLALGPGDEISHVQRIYLFKRTTQTTQYKFFADDKCTKPTYSFVFKGGVAMGKPITDMPNTVEAKVTFKRIFFTLDSPRGAKAAAKCADGKFDVGVQRDVSASNCLFMKPVKSCGVDYDIVKIKDGVATPGFRTANMCKPTGRPTKLQTAGANFAEQF